MGLSASEPPQRRSVDGAITPATDRRWACRQTVWRTTGAGVNDASTGNQGLAPEPRPWHTAGVRTPGPTPAVAHGKAQNPTAGTRLGFRARYPTPALCLHRV